MQLNTNGVNLNIMTISDIITAHSTFHIPQDILDVVEDKLSVFYQLDEISREECVDCEYSGIVNYYLISGFGPPTALITAYYCDGDLEDTNINDVYDRPDFVRFQGMVADIIRPLIMEKIFNININGL